MALLLLLDPFHLYLLFPLLPLHPWFPFPIHVSCPIPKWANVFKVFTAASLKAPVAIYFHFCLRIEGSRRRRQTPDKQAGVGMRGCRDGVLPVGCRAAWWLPGCQAWRSPRWRADDFSLLFYFYHILICRCRRCFNCTCCCYCSRHKSLLPSQQGIHSSGLPPPSLLPSHVCCPSRLLAFISIFLPRESISCETSPHVCYFVCVCASLDDSITFISLIETKNPLIVIILGLRQGLQAC